MLNIEKIFECIRNIMKEKEVIANCHDKNSKSNVFLSDVDENFKEHVINSIGNIKKEISNIQQIYDSHEPCLSCSAITECKVALKGSETKCYDLFKLDMENYERFFEKIINSELFIDHIDIFVERYVSVVYTDLQRSYKKIIRTMPTLKKLLECG